MVNVSKSKNEDNNCLSPLLLATRPVRLTSQKRQQLSIAAFAHGRLSSAAALKNLCLRLLLVL